MATNDTQNLLKAGITAAKAGNKALARQLLEQVLETDDNNEMAWMWMAMVVDTPRDKRVCLEQVLEINPNNQRAKEALEKLQPDTTTGPAPTAASFRGGASPAQSRSTPTSKPLPPIDDDIRATPRSRQAPAGGRRGGNRLLSLPFLAAIAAAIAFVLLGVYFVVTPTSTPTPTSNLSGLVTGTASTEVAAVVTSGPTIPVVATIETLDPNRITALPTITPSPTIPVSPIPPTETLPPSTNYRFVFVGEGRSRSHKALYRINGDGSDESLLISGDADISDIAVAPNGSIAYVTASENKPQVFVADKDGKNGKAITKLSGKYVGGLAWSAQSDTLAFVSDDPGNNEIYTVNTDGNNLTRITDNKVDDRDPTWSPVGKLIIYASNPTGKALQLFSINLEDKKPVQLTDALGDSYSPAVNSDGTKVVFVSNRDRYPAIYTMPLQGDVRSAQLISYKIPSATNRDPVWSPDDRYVLFASTGDSKVFNLYLLTPDGKTLLPITKNTGAKENSYGARFVSGG